MNILGEAKLIRCFKVHWKSGAKDILVIGLFIYFLLLLVRVLTLTIMILTLY